jgi:HD-GYP domain-containing protein (c-di-GMP phosphodiesterase class II)
MDSSIEGFLLFDEDLNCVSINSAVERLFRVSEKDVVGKNILEVVPCIDDTVAKSEYLNVMFDGGPSIAHSEFGGLRLSIKAFKVGNGLGIILGDATDRPKSESERCEIEQQLDLAGKLAALSELTSGLAQELNTLAGEQAALDKVKGAQWQQNGASGCDARASFHSREMASYLKEFNRAMSQLVGTKEMAGLEEGYWQMARTLALMAETREPYARGHSERVGLLANEIAVWIGCPAELIREIQLAAILHDVGKIVIPDHILYKPGGLTLAEYSEIMRHPAASVDIVGNLNRFDELVPMIESHHERYDGSGYPSKLKADGIHLGARILAVADAYDAMTSPRPHRARLSNEEAIRTINDGSGAQWDPMVVHAFMEMIGPEKEPVPVVADQRTEHRDVAEPPAASPEQAAAPTGGQPDAEVAGDGLSDMAQEALKRAEQWAHWMECMDGPEKGGKHST